MNKIIIIGHPDSGHAQVEELLYRCGMKAANPSIRDGLTPTEVIGSICKAMRLSNVDEITNPDDFKQCKPDAIWNSLVLDLMLGNLEHDLWGWADSQALFLMEYLEGLDSQLTFVLVYDDPKSVLLQSPHGHEESDTELIFQERLDRWVAYNSAMLHFFLRNQNRCILVHAKGVQLAAEQYLSMLQARLSAPLQVPKALAEAKSSTGDLACLSFDSNSGLITADAMLGGALHLTGDLSNFASEDFFAKDAESFLIDQFLLQHPASQHLFEELQASSNLPIALEVGQSTSAESAWKAFQKQRWFASRLVGRIHEDSQQRALNDLKHAEEQLRLHEKLQMQEERMASSSLEFQRQKDDNEHRAAAQKLLIDQLNQAKEAAEGFYLQNEDLQKELKKLGSEFQPLRRENGKYVEEPPLSPAPKGAPERVKAQLSYRLGAIMKQQSKSITGLLRMPFTLLKEKRNFDKKRLESPKEKLPPLHEYEDAHLAECVKNQLSYRLGSVVVRNSKTFHGWLCMPFSILHQIHAFNKLQASKDQ